MSGQAGRVAEAVARRSYGRLVAFLAARGGDVAAAEDALADAFRIALETWPRSGAPANPEGWLMTVARRSLANRARHRRVEEAALPALLEAIDEAQDRACQDDAADFPDKRLELLFACAHPAIEASARAPLMLQVVIGLDAGRIASAFLVSPAAMAQRLVRAKAKIRDAGLVFEIVDRGARAPRLDSVLEAIYAAYGSGWEGLSGADENRRELAGEAIWLGRALAECLPDEPEALGLLAIMLYCEARSPARREPGGRYVPLGRQDPAIWDGTLIGEADRFLVAAGRRNRFGPYQCEAAIQAVHAARRQTGVTDWPALATLYDVLAHMRPVAGVLVSRAAAVAAVQGAAAGLALLDAMEPSGVRSYQPYWAVRAHVAAESGRVADATEAYARAIGLSEDAAVRSYLSERRDAVRSARDTVPGN